MRKVLSKITYFILTITLACAVFLKVDTASFVTHADTLVDSGLNYTETLDPIINPSQGFYKAFSYIMIPDRSELSDDINYESLAPLVGRHSLIHFNFGLESRSSNMTYEYRGERVRGEDEDITPEMLECLDKTFALIRDLGFTMIPRFCYNVKGISPAEAGLSGSGTYAQAEPSLELMQRHIAQLKPLLHKYKDVIDSVDVGILGPWGEMHTTSAAQNVATTNAIIDAMLDAVPTDRTVGIRYPLQYAQWYNAKYNKGWSGNSQLIQAYDMPRNAGTPESRINMFNDGYLGSSSDLGTFRVGRAAETPWMNRASEFAPYGGEVVSNNGVTSGDGIGAYNKIEYIAWEGFITHTSYLNIDWNYQFVISKWQETPYRVGTLASNTVYDNVVYPSGSNTAVLDTLYSENEATAFNYVQNRLGYRLVVRDSKHTSNVSAGGKVTVEGVMENMGFGNVTRPKKVTAILAKKDGTIAYETDVTSKVNVRDWKSRNFNNPDAKTSFAFDVTMPQGAQNGVYDIYLKISNNDEAIENTNMRTIRFANNDQTMWNATLGANRLGTVVCGQGYYANFFNTDGTYLGTAEAQSGGTFEYTGETPISPDVTIDTDYVFEGFDKPLTNASANITATAKYREIVRQYVVSFFDHAGELLGTQKFDYGTSLTKAMLVCEVPQWYEDIYKYTFDTWADFADGFEFKGDLSLYASYTQGYRDFTVTFNGNGGTLVSGETTQTVMYGNSCVAPIFEREGYIFVGWSDSINYISVSGDITVYAVWVPEYQSEEEPIDDGKGCSGSVNPLESFGLTVLLLSLGLACIVVLKRKSTKNED